MGGLAGSEIAGTFRVLCRRVCYMRRIPFLFLLVSAASFPVFGSVDAGLLALVPPDAKVISGLDLEHARSSEFGQYMTGKANTTDHELDQFVHDTGFDPRHDLQQVLFAVAGPDTSGQTSSFAVLARGNFDQERIKTAAKAKGMAPQAFQGVVLFVDKSQNDKSQNKGPSAFALLGDGVAVMGDTGTVKKIIANRGTASVLDPAMQAQVSKVGTDNDAWFVSFLSGEHLANHLSQAQASANGSNQPANPILPQAEALQSVLQASGGMHFGNTVEFSFDAITRSPKDATSLADVVRFFASMVQMSRQKDPRADIAASAFDNMNLTTDGDAMHFSISLPEKSLEQLIESAPTSVPVHPRAEAVQPHAQ
jgi:hypothetical protein